MNNFLDYWNSSALGGGSRFEQVGMPDANELTIQSIVEEMLYYVPYLNPESPILEIGCGNGLILDELQKRGFLQLAGADYSAEMIAKAQHYCQGIKFLKLDAGSLDSEFESGTFDLIYLHSVTQYFGSQGYFNQFLEGCLNLLSENGSLYIGDVFNAYVNNYYMGASKRGRLALLRKFFSRSTPKEKNFYLDLDGLRNLQLEKRGFKVYPLLEWLNNKSLMFKALRYNILITKCPIP